MREDNQNNIKNKTENGSVIVWIFIAVLLFAALGYAFNSSSRTSAGFISDAQAEAYANQIMDILHTNRQVVKKLLLSGCPAEEISFQGAGG